MSATPNINSAKISGFPLNKFDATSAPTTGDDSADGYSVGSKWIDVTNDKAYNCVDATAGAAVWNEAGGGADTNLGNTNLTLTGDRTVDLLTHTLTLDGTGNNSTHFQVNCNEVYTGITPYLKVNLNGGISVMGSSSSEGAISAYSGHPSSQPRIFNVGRFGGGEWFGTSIALRTSSTGAGISLVSGSSLQIHDVNNILRHDIGVSTGSGNQHCKFYANGYTNSGDFIIGASTAIGTENISLQGNTLVKGSDNSVSTTGLKFTDVNDNILLDFRNNGQLGFGGIYISANTYTFRNPAGRPTIARFDDDGTGTESFFIQQNGQFKSEQSGQTVFLSYRQSGQSWIKLYDAGVESIRLGKQGSFINGALRVGGVSGSTTGTTGARFEIQQASTNTYQQLFFANARAVTLGRINSSGSFGADQKGLECYDTDLNKKFFWNGSAWEQIVSGGATSGEGTKVLVQGRMDTTQSFTSAAGRIDYVDNSTLGFDINGEWDNTTHRFTVASSGAGTYQFINSLFVDNSSGWIQIFCKKNGVTQRISASDFASSWDTPRSTTNIELAVGDYVEFWADSTTNFSVNANWYALNNFQITKIGDSVTVNNVVLPSLTKTIILESPADADYIPIFRTDVEITIQEALGALMAAGDVDVRLYWDTDLANTSPTAIGASTTLTTTSEAAVDISTDATVPANSWIFLDIGTVATAATTVVNIRYTE